MGRLEKVMNYTSNMNVGRESDDRVVPAKCSNKDGGWSSAESAEGRRSAKENSGQTTASQTQCWSHALHGLLRVREAETGFYAIYPRQEPHAGMLPVRIRAGVVG